jgi:hypothetical protein
MRLSAGWVWKQTRRESMRLRMLTMSEYLENVEIHQTPDTVEMRWTYEGKQYGLLMNQAMFDVLDITDGLPAPILSKLMRPVVIRDGDKMNVEVQL